MKTTKKLLIILLTTIICLIYIQIISLAQTATITTETLRLRKEATTNSSILELISEGEKVEILESGLGDDGEWYKVKYKNITGYVYGEFIKIDNSTTNSNNENNTTNQNTNTNTNTENNQNTTTNTNNENTNTTVEENNINTNNTVENNNEEPENNEENNNEEIENNENNNNEEPENNEENTNQEEIDIAYIEINTDMTVKEDTEIYIIPLINAEKINTVKPEEKLHIIQIVNGWVYVNLENNTYGWIRCNKLI